MVTIDLYSRGDITSKLSEILKEHSRGGYKFGTPKRAKLKFGILGTLYGVAIPVESKYQILFISSRKNVLCHDGAFMLKPNPLWKYKCLFVKPEDLTYLDYLKV